jgi:hypothetical protein
MTADSSKRCIKNKGLKFQSAYATELFQTFQSFHWFQTLGTLGFLNSAACNI